MVLLIRTVRISANIKRSETAVTVRDVRLVFLDRSLKMRVLIVFAPGDICSQAGKHSYLSVVVVAKSGDDIFMVTAADIDSLSSHSKAARSTVFLFTESYGRS